MVTELNTRISSIIEEITSSREKVIPIRELHKIRLMYPQLDIKSYIDMLSPAFKRFVIDTLAKLGM